MSDESKYWRQFYASKKAVIEPSDFAKFVAERYPHHRAVVEFGCGNGRDSVYFAQSGRHVCGIDLCREAIDQCNQLAQERGVSQLSEFRVADVNDATEILSILRAQKRRDEPTIFYARFFLHSIDETRERSLFDIVGASLANEDVFCLEFRTTHDIGTPKLFGDHYRRFLKVGEVLALCKRNQLEIEYSVEGNGLAVYGNEDPYIARILARRERNA